MTTTQETIFYSLGEKEPCESVKELTTEEIWAWNENEPALVNYCAHELIRLQTERTPKAVAVDAHDAIFTYQELDELSNRLAHHLVEQGIKPEEIVPLCFEKSAWAIVSILGVIKAGAAIVFIDSSHPEKRRQVVTDQVEARFIISSAEQASLWVLTPLLVIVVDAKSLEGLPKHTKPPATTVLPTNLLYVIFTSGSTGTPKGCLIEHSAFCSGSVQHAAKGCISESSRVLQLASYSFDVSILEILTSLIHGACICTPNMAEMAQGPAAIINNRKITWAFLTPSLSKLVNPAEVPTLKTLALGGEALSVADVQTWAGHLQLLNGYGPSECSIAAVGNQHVTPTTDPCNIGWPVGGICWVVDPDNHHQLLSVGEVGELLIEGPILARGYLKMQEKTDEVFIKCPAWGPKTKTGSDRRLYKTGDLAKFNTDGSLHFVGRKDTQVKLRGLRVELGEIEHHIESHSSVRHKLVMMPKSGRFKDRLVAVISLNDFIKDGNTTGMEASNIQLLRGEAKYKSDAQIRSIREHLQNLVPEYMVPETWVILVDFPLLLSGKLNRSMMQTWIHEADENLHAEIVGLSVQHDQKLKVEATAMECTVREMYSSVLNLPSQQIELDRSFLSLGGDSISAIQMISRFRALGLSFTLKDILRSKSISELALCAEPLTPTKYSVEEIFDRSFPLSPIQQMYFNLASRVDENAFDPHFNQSFLLKTTKEVMEPDLKKALDLIVARHSMLRARFSRSQDGTWNQRILAATSDSYAFSAHPITSNEGVALVMSRTQLLLDIERGPVFAVNLFNYLNGDQQLFLVAHHVVIDLVSWRVMLRDLEEILTTGSLVAETPLPFQNWLQLQDDHERSRETPFQSLPFEVPDPDFQYWGMIGSSNTIRDTTMKKISLGQQDTAALLGESCHRPLNTETIDILLATIICSFSSIFNDRDEPAVFREGHGREPWHDSIDISQTVGWFTTMYPMFFNCPRNLIDAVIRAKDIRHSIPSNGRPYFASRYLADDGKKAFGKHELVEICFDYLGLYQQFEGDNALLQQVEGYDALAGDVGPDVPRFALIEITAQVILGQMELTFILNRHMKGQDKLMSWIQSCKQLLEQCITDLPELKPASTLADFPLLSLTYDGLEVLVNDRLPQIGIDTMLSIESIYPCSPMQDGLLISQDRSESGCYEYNHIFLIECRKMGESVDIANLARAWEMVVQRHASLRTIFIESIGRAGIYDQIVLKNQVPEILFTESKEDGSAEVFANQAPLKFQKNKSPHRLTICRMPSGQAQCKLEINHAIIDGESIANLFIDLTLAYDGKLSRKPAFQFERYISFVMDASSSRAIDFWKEHLTGATPCLFPEMAVLEDASDPRREWKFVETKIELLPVTLMEFCARQNVTLVNLFQLAWALVLSIYTESKDVTFGYLSSGRDAPLNHIEEGVGAFLTMLVSRLTFDGNAKLSELLDQVAQNFTTSLPHQYCGLSSIQHSLKLEGQPLFNTIMSFHRDIKFETPHDSSIKISSRHGHDPTEYALAVDIGVSDEQVTVLLEYWTSDFTNQQVANISSTFIKALACIVARPSSQITDVDMVSQDHLLQMERFNSHVTPSVDRCIHDVIQVQVALRPDHEAICSWEGSWTYKELDRASTVLACHLRTLGVGPEIIVPHCFPKSAWTIISILAILKSGGAVVALDPTHPKERLQGLMEQVNATIVLTSSQISHLFDGILDVENVIVVDGKLLDRLQDHQISLCSTVKPHNAAFVVFTSGTTGKPKGIVLEHSAMCTSSATMGPILGIGPETRILQYAAYTFDVSLQDIVTNLQRGGTICIISDHDRMNDIAHGINTTRANWMDVTNTVASLLRPSEVSCMKRLNNGGEALTRDVINIWADHVDLYNLYGPAETSINNTCSKRLSNRSAATNIGKAYGCRVWIVDEQNFNRLVPVGVAGEVLIEGPILARGYLNDSSKTHAAFIENPPWSIDGSGSSRRFYRSGDLCSFNTDGSLSIIGRRDTQFKIHGQRVELDEITYQVQTRLPDGQLAVVDAVSTDKASKRKTIVAYIFSPDYAETDEKCIGIAIPIDATLLPALKNLQASLSNSLPAYMIPAMYIPVTEIPSTQSGKLDRTTLRLTVTNLSRDQVSHFMLAAHRGGKIQQPFTKHQKAVQQIWSDVLRLEVDAIDTDDNFFRLGGDSFLAMKAVAIARSMNLTLSVGQIFANPILADLAQSITDSNIILQQEIELRPFQLLGGRFDIESLVEQVAQQCMVTKEDVEDMYPVSALQETLLAQSLRGIATYLAQKVFEIGPHVDVLRFMDSWDQIVQAHDILRTCMVYTPGGETLQTVLRIKIPWITATVLGTYLTKDSNKAVRMGEPLMRLAIVRESSGKSYFVWSAHHIIYDGWTIETLFAAVAQVYQGNTVPNQVPFKAFIKHLGHINKAHSDEYWQSKFSSEASEATGYPFVSVGYQASSKIRISHQAKFHKSSLLGITASTLLRAAWAVVVSLYSDSRDVIFASTLSGRDVPVVDIDSIMGPTITTVPIRVKVPSNGSIADYLRSVQEESLSMKAYEHTGLQNIRRLSSEAKAAVDRIQTLFIIQPPEEVRSFLDMEDVPVPASNFESYALVLECSLPKTDSFEIHACFDKDIIPMEQTKRMLYQLEQVMQQLAWNFDQDMSEIELLSAHDLEEIRHWNNLLPSAVNQTVHESISIQVHERPSAPAICAWDGEFSYSEMDRFSTKLGKHLQTFGATQESKIGLCFDKSVWNVVSLIAVLKASGACVQLLPDYPSPRMRSILNDVEAKIVLCAPQHAHLFHGIVPNVIAVEPELFGVLPDEIGTEMTSMAQPHNTAFVVFTSGSTGRPKGVMIDHSGFCTMAYHQGTRLNMGPETRTFQFSTHTFDISLFDSLATLVLGGCVCIPSEEERMNDIVGAINRLKVNGFAMVPSVADTFHPEDVPGVKWMALGGEAMRKNVHDRWAPKVKLFNAYGPAECSILAVIADSPPGALPACIGRGVGCRTWITEKDNHDRLVPIGGIGELLIEGPIVTPGYFNDSVKTLASYILNPSWSQNFCPSPMRLYKTGDLVRYGNDGALIYVGRKDTQIKIRGLRVELGEVEHHVKESGFDAHTFAVERIFQKGDMNKPALAVFFDLLIAMPGSSDRPFLQMTAELEAELTKLKIFLGQFLQSYMVPTLYLPLLSMPQTQTGKSDRNALRRIGAELSERELELYSLGNSEVEKCDPVTTTEVLLQKLWAKVLDLPESSISASDNFFVKGGDSIRAMLLTSSARQADFRLTVAEIFASPVLRDMALIVTNTSTATHLPELEPFALSGIDKIDSLKVFLAEVSSTCEVDDNQIEDIYPCTPLQEGLMALSLQHKNAYMARRVFKLGAKIDIILFKKAWEVLFQMHPILRTRIVQSKDLGAMQVVVNESLRWHLTDSLDNYLKSDKEISLEYGDPLTRFAIDANNEHFIWTAHHVVYDGFSTGLLFEQLDELYHGGLVPHVTGFSRFIKHITEIDPGLSAAFWKTYLSGGAPTSFPHLSSTTYQPRPNQEVKKSFKISTMTASQYIMSTILRAAWAIVTARYMDSDDVVFAVTLSGRTASVEGIETMMGPTITTVPVRVRLDAKKNVQEFLEDVQKVAAEMIPFEHTGIQNIHALGSEVQSALVLKNLFVVQQPNSKTSKQNLLEECSDATLLEGFHTYAVVIECILVDESSVDIEVQFDNSVIQELQVNRILDQLENVVNQLILAPTTKTLGEVDLFGSADLQQVLRWDNELSLEVVNACAHEVFREQVMIRPNAEATCSWEGSLTYAEVDKLSHNLASFLVENGVGVENLVPLCFEKSIWTVVTMMAVLKSGGACVHLGTSQPTTRFTQIIKDTGATIMLADGKHWRKFKDLIRVVIIDRPFLESLSSGSLFLLPLVSHTNPAFVLYTSGSTGIPKGIVVEHGSLCTSSKAHGTNRNVGPHTRLLQFAAYTFDVSVADILTTLQRGGCVCIPSETERTDDLAGAINRMDANYAFLTPTVAKLLKPQDVPGLQTLILGGEMLSQENIQTWAPHVRLAISYGMAECSIHCVDAVPLDVDSHPADLGKPSGCSMWIVDANDHNRLAPIGCTGELVIEGRVVSRGYLNDKLKTDLAFIESPQWASAAGRRMYKTGDLVKYTESGNIFYVGRKDFQVKHHGQRIELAEVEHHLLAHGEVRHAVCLVPRSGYSNDRLVGVLSLRQFTTLVGYVDELEPLEGIQKEMSELQISRIRGALAGILPGYMIPAIWIVVKALPQTPNGKMDRVRIRVWIEEMDQALHDRATNVEIDEGFPLSTTDEELKLQGIFCKVLNLPKINLSRSFLDLGGDSISAMQARSLCHNEGITIAVQDILRSTSISQLALVSKFSTPVDGAFEEVLDVQFRLSTAQNMFIRMNRTSYQNVGDAHVTVRCAFLQVAFPITITRLTKALEAVIQQHSMLRARLDTNSNGIWKQHITDDVSSSYDVQAHAVSGLEGIWKIINNRDLSLNCKTGPTATIRSFKVEAKSSTPTTHQFLLLSIHPLIADERALNIVLRDLNCILATGIFAIPKPLSFQAWVEREKISDQNYNIDMSSTELVSTVGVALNQADTFTTTDDLFLDPSTSDRLWGTSNLAFRTKPMDIIIAAIAYSFSCSQTRSKPVTILYEDSNQEVNQSDTVGCIDSIISMEVTVKNDIIQILKEVKDFRCTSRIASTCSVVPRSTSLAPHLEVFVDVVDSRDWEVSNEMLQRQCRGEIQDAIFRNRATNLEPSFSVFVEQTRVGCNIKFTSSGPTSNTTELGALAQNSVVNLQKLVDRLDNMENEKTLSDFPLLTLDYPQLQQLNVSTAKLGLRPQNIETILSCAPIQQHMIASQQLCGDTYQGVTVHEICSTNPSEVVDVGKLRRAWQILTHEHEALRTIFIPDPINSNRFFQIVLKEYLATVNVIDCEETQVQMIARAHTALNYTEYRPHNQLTLFKTEHKIYCKLEISHALQDGMSTRIIYRDFARAYVNQIPSRQARGFRAYVTWLQQQDLKPAISFWGSYLSGLEPCILPHDVHRPLPGRKNQFLPIVLKNSIAQYKECCKLHRVTMATIFQAAWILTLDSYTQSGTVLFGFMTANRDVPIEGISNMVGPLINMLLCGFNVNGDGGVAEFLQNVQEGFLNTLQYQYGVIQAMHDQLNGGSGTAEPLWNTVLSLEYAGAQQEQEEPSSDLQFKMVYGNRSPEYDMVVGVMIGETAVETQLGFWDNCFTEEFATGVALTYASILGRIVGGGEEKVLDLVK